MPLKALRGALHAEFLNPVFIIPARVIQLFVRLFTDLSNFPLSRLAAFLQFKVLLAHRVDQFQQFKTSKALQHVFRHALFLRIPAALSYGSSSSSVIVGSIPLSTMDWYTL